MRIPNVCPSGPVVGLALVIGLMACQADGFDPDDPAGLPGDSAGLDRTLARIRALGFREADIQDRGDSYLVQGDMLFDKERGLPGDLVGDLSQRWVGSLASRETIRVMIDTASVLPFFVTATENAMQKWNAVSGTSLRFERVFSDPKDIFVVANASFPGACAVANYPAPPAPSGSTGQSIQIQQGVPNCPADVVMLHEIGHTVGLRHTDDCAAEVPGFTCDQVPGVGPDDFSVMLSTAAVSNFLNFSDNDRLAMQSLYPASMAAASRLPGRVDVFMVNRAGRLRRFTTFQDPAQNPNQWFDHGNMFPGGATFDNQIAAVSHVSGTVNVFGLAADRTIRHFSWTGSGPGTWASLGNPFPAGQGFIGQLTAVSTANNTMAIIGLGQDQQVKMFNFNGSSWVAFGLTQQFANGLKLNGQLSAVSWDGVAHIFGMGGAPHPQHGTATSTTLLDLWWGGGANGWQWGDMASAVPDLAANLFRGQVTAFTYQGKPSIFGVAQNQATLKQLYWTGSGWAWDTNFLPAQKFVGPLSGASMGANRLHIFGLAGGFGAVGDDIRKGGSLVGRVFSSSWSFINFGNGWPL